MTPEHFNPSRQNKGTSSFYRQHSARPSVAFATVEGFGFRVYRLGLFVLTVRFCLLKRFNCGVHVQVHCRVVHWVILFLNRGCCRFYYRLFIGDLVELSGLQGWASRLRVGLGFKGLPIVSIVVPFRGYLIGS